MYNNFWIDETDIEKYILHSMEVRRYGNVTNSIVIQLAGEKANIVVFCYTDASNWRFNTTVINDIRYTLTGKSISRTEAYAKLLIQEMLADLNTVHPRGVPLVEI